MGDFNYHIDSENSEGEREPDRIFLDFIETSFMQQHVMEPTRGKNILDLVITSDENMIENRGRQKFGFGFGLGAESWQMAAFGIVWVSAEGRKLPFGFLSVSAEIDIDLRSSAEGLL